MKKYYIGLDVHKESIAIAHTFSGTRDEPVYYGKCGGSNLSAERALRRLAAKLGVKLQDLRVCYDAGPTGFVLARRQGSATGCLRAGFQVQGKVL